MNPNDFQIRNGDGDPDWEKILQVLITYVRLNRIGDKNRRGQPEDVAQSAIKTTLKTSTKWGEGDTEFFELLFFNVRRKINTARGHYRTGHGQNVPFSELASDEFQFLDHLGGAPPIIATAGTSDGPALDEADAEEAWIVRQLGERLDTWLAEEFSELSELEKQVANLWMQNYTIAEMASETSVSVSTIKRAREQIRDLLDPLEGEI